MRRRLVLLCVSFAAGAMSLLAAAHSAAMAGGPPDGLTQTCTAESQTAASSGPTKDNPNTRPRWVGGGDLVVERYVSHVENEDGGLVRAPHWEQIAYVKYDPRSICEKHGWVGCGNPASPGGGSPGGPPGSDPGGPGGSSNGPGGSGESGDSGGGESAFAPPVLTSVTEPTCDSITITGDGIQCQPNCPAGPAVGSVPCMGVVREPYPRGLVSLPNTFTLIGPYAGEGAAVFCPRPAEHGQFPSITNASLKIVWEMRPDILPVWNFDERPWNIARGAPNTVAGFVVQHVFETASFSAFEGDKPFNGPGLTAEPLSAYQVTVATYWTPYLIREWDEMGFDEQGNYVVKAHVVRKDRIDLRQYGYPTSDFRSTFGRDHRAPRYEPYRCNVPTPIIEVQAVLTSP